MDGGSPVGLFSPAVFAGSWEWDQASGLIFFSEGLASLLGVDAALGHSPEVWFSWVHPDDLPRVRSASREVLASPSASLDIEYRVVPPSSFERVLRLRAQVVRETSGSVRLVGMVVDVSAARRSQGELFAALEGMPAPFLTVDRELRLLYVNAAAEVLLGSPRSELLSVPLPEVLPEFSGEFLASLPEGFFSPVDLYVASLDRWFALAVYPFEDGFSLHLVDVTARRRSEVERARLLQEALEARSLAELVSSRLRFLSSLSARLASLSCVEDVGVALVESSLGVLGDWVILYVPRSGLLVRVAARHVDPDLDGFARSLVGVLPVPLSLPSFVSRAFFSQEPVLVDVVDDAVVANVPPGAYQQALRLLGDASGLVVPLVAAGETVAVLVSGWRSFRASSAELELAVEAASRAAAAFAATRVLSERTEVARVLSRALLPAELPMLPGWPLHAVYLPGARSLDVGGDFYDAFLLSPDRLCVAIGDVAGSGLPAAAVMGQVRSALRAYAFSGVDSPSGLLSAVGGFLSRSHEDVLCTALVGVVELSSGMFSFASAGHLLPILVSDGRSRLLECMVAPPLGSPVEVVPEVCEFRLPAGSRLLLYTDGLVEDRRLGIDVGLTRLRLLAERLSSSPLAAFDAGEFGALFEGGLSDDVCALLLERDA